MEEKLDDLKDRLVVLEKELAEEWKLVEKKEKEINNHPGMKIIVKKEKELKEKKSVIEKQKDIFEQKIKEQFFLAEHSYSRPYFRHKTGEWGEETNIYDDVLEEIKQHSPLYLLKNDDIDNVVKALVDKTVEKCPELVELERQYNVLSNKIDELWEAERSLDRELRTDFSSKVHSLQREASRIEEQLANPKKFIEQEKRYSKRDKARNKLKDPAIIDEIYRRLEIKIPKIKK